jgi:Flavodoxin
MIAHTIPICPSVKSVSNQSTMKFATGTTILLMATTARFAEGFAPSIRSAQKAPMMTPLFANVGIWYSSSTGNTETVAAYIAKAAGVNSYNDIGDAKTDEIEGADALIVGAPTWHTGADEQRSGTSWDDWYVGRSACFNVASCLLYLQLF